MVDNNNNFWNDVVSVMALLIAFVVSAYYKLAWLHSVKNILALIVVGTACIMAADGQLESKDFMLVVSLIINFFFLADKVKDKNNKKGEQ